MLSRGLVLLILLQFPCLTWAAAPSVQHPLRFGIFTPQQGDSLEEVTTLWQQAETWGYDSLWLCDHLLALPKETEPIYEAWSLLAGLAVKTSRVRIGVMVTSNTFRHPAVLAKMATTVDHLSHGRLELGIGGGWYQREHQAYGLPFYSEKERITRLEETLQVLKQLWTKEEATFTGQYYRLEKAPFAPKPVQKPHPPIRIGGRGRKWTLPLVARYADTWDIPDLLPPKRLATEIAYLNQACAAVSRDCTGMDKSHFTFLVFAQDPERVEQTVQELAAIFRMSVGDLRRASLVGTTREEITAQVQAFVDAGITHLILNVWKQPYDREGLKRFANEVMPAFR